MGGTCRNTSAVSTVLRNRLASTVPGTLARPPAISVPPTSATAIDCSSMWSPVPVVTVAEPV